MACAFLVCVHVMGPNRAYMLSPIIYSATIKLHPVVILTALYVVEHLVGIQGLFLAVPVTMFIIKHLIFSPDVFEEEKKQEGLEAGDEVAAAAPS